MKSNYKAAPKIEPIHSSIWTPMNVLLLASLVLLVIWTFNPVSKLGFVWDDLEYVQTNKMLAQPLTKSIAHFFGQNYYVGNYHPITMSSYALIYQKAKLVPELYHQVILLFHVLNTLMVFWFVLILSDKKFAVALLVSALFGVHPMHVESVAWISELKDVLFSFFFIAGLIAYLKSYASPKSWYYILLSFVFFVFSVLSKPAAVCFPLVLMCLDYYKLDKPLSSTLWNKIPFFIVALIMGLVTIKAQGKAVGTIEQYTILERIMLSSFASIFYIFKLFIPTQLSALHPFPAKTGGVFPMIFKLAPFLLAFIIFAIWYFRKQSKILVFGFLFFFANILLVLQFLTVGMAVVSERYTYMPYIGLFFILAMGMDQYLNSKTGKLAFKSYLMYASYIPVFLFAWLSKDRVQIWQNNKTLWTDVIKKYPESAVAYYNLGTYYLKEKNDDDSASAWFQKTIQKDPNHDRALINLGLINGRRKNKDLAMEYFKRAEKVNPDFFELYKNRGFVHSLFGDTDLALADFSKYLNLVPHDAQILYGRGLIYQFKKETENAYLDFSNAAYYDAQNANYWMTKSETAFSLGKLEDARADFNKAIRLGAKPDPNFKQQLGL